jgi:hypothetical protein
MKEAHLYLFTALVLLFALNTSSCGQDRWISLFDGDTLKGWSDHSGHATYRVEDGTIVEQAVKESPNSFLCTEREFSDFILEFEVYLDDDELNSGVQFRSQIAKQEMEFWLCLLCSYCLIFLVAELTTRNGSLTNPGCSSWSLFPQRPIS